MRFFNEKPVVAMMSHSNFGSSQSSGALKVRHAVEKMQEMYSDLAIDGEMQIGFALDKVSAGEYDITALPSVLDNSNAEAALRAILTRAADQTETVHEQMQQQIALTLAQSAAISMGKTMSEAEMQALLHKLFTLPSYRITPDGKTVVVCTHNGAIIGFFAAITNATPAEIQDVDGVTNNSVTEIDYSDGKYGIINRSYDKHLGDLRTVETEKGLR